MFSFLFVIIKSIMAREPDECIGFQFYVLYPPVERHGRFSPRMVTVGSTPTVGAINLKEHDFRTNK